MFGKTMGKLSLQVGLNGFDWSIAQGELMGFADNWGQILE
jgi:hypothetical protein